MFDKEKVLRQLSAIDIMHQENVLTSNSTRKACSKLDEDLKKHMSLSNLGFSGMSINPRKTVDDILEAQGSQPQIGPLPGCNIWCQLNDEFNKERNELEEYKLKKNPPCKEVEASTVHYISKTIFSLLGNILKTTIFKAIETGSLKYEKSPFNAIDNISESLWNQNPMHPDRQNNALFIHDMDWVKEYLKENPRPYLPLSWIWSKDYAATKIQSYVRAYWVRRRVDVQEMRKFWIDIKNEYEE